MKDLGCLMHAHHADASTHQQSTENNQMHRQMYARVVDCPTMLAIAPQCFPAPPRHKQGCIPKHHRNIADRWPPPPHFASLKPSRQLCPTPLKPNTQSRNLPALGWACKAIDGYKPLMCGRAPPTNPGEPTQPTSENTFSIMASIMVWIATSSIQATSMSSCVNSGCRSARRSSSRKQRATCAGHATCVAWYGVQRSVTGFAGCVCRESSGQPLQASEPGGLVEG